MEIIIGLIVIAVTVYFMLRKPKAVEAVEEAVPYKVETPVAAEAPVETKKETVKKATTRKPKAPAAKKPAAKKATTRKPKAK
jgi:hypothetical protein